MNNSRLLPGSRHFALLTLLLALPAAAQSLSSVTLSPTSVTGGASSTGTVTLSANAPAGGKVVALSSANTGVATVPASVTVASGTKTKTFVVSTVPRSSNTTVVISGVLSGVTKTRTLTVKAPAMSAASVSPTSVTGGTGATLTVTLTGNAPTGGTVVTLTSGNTQAATLPASVTVLAGAKTATAAVTSLPVATNATVVLTATAGGVSKTKTLTVTRAALTSLTSTPATIPGGGTATGTLTLNGPAGPSGATVTLSSNRTNVATVPASTQIAAGQTTGTFTITGAAVAADGLATISATLGSATRTASITVTRTIGTLTGTVRDASTLFTLPSAHVVLTADPAMETWTDANGQYQLADVPSGTQTVDVSYDQFSTVTSSPVTVTNGQTVAVPPVSLMPNRGTISGAILDEGNERQPLEGALVTDATGLHTTTSDASGHYELTGLEPGFTYLVIYKAAFRPGASEEFSVDAGWPAQADVAVSPVWEEDRPGEIEGVVRDAAGNPVGGAAVSIVGVPGFGTTSEPDGRYKLTVPAANALVVEAQKTGYRRTLSRSLRASAGNRPFHLAHDFVLPLADATGTIELRTFDLVSRGPFRGDLWFRTPAGVWHAPVPESGIRTVTGVPAGLVWGCMGPALLPAGESLTMNCPGEPVVPEGSPRWAAAGIVMNRYSYEPVAGATATFVNGSTVVPVTTDAKGFFSYQRGPVGDYSITAEAAGFNQTEPWMFTAADNPENGNFYGIAWFWPEMPGGSVLITAPQEGALLTDTSIRVEVTFASTRPGDQLLWAWAWPSEGNVTSVTPVFSADGQSAVITIEGDFPNGPLTLGLEAASRTGVGFATERRVVVGVPSRPTNLTVSPEGASGDYVATGTVTIDRPAPAGGASVSLSSSSPAAVVPASILVAEGETTGTFDVVASRVEVETTATITASAAGSSVSAAFTMYPVAVNIAWLSLSAPGVFPGESLTGTVELSYEAPTGGYLVTLTSSSADVVVPSTVTVPAGASSAAFTVSVAATATGSRPTITGSSPGSSRGASFNVVVLQSFTASASAAGPGVPVNLTLLFSSAIPAGRTMTVALTSSAPAVASIPATAVFAAGQIWATVPVSRVDVAVDTPVDFTATAYGTARTAHFVAEPLRVKSVIQTSGRTTISPCGSETLAVYLNGYAPAGGTPVDVTIVGGHTAGGTAIAGSSPPARRFTVPAGSGGVNVDVLADWTAVPASLVLTARNGSSEASGSLALTPGTARLRAFPSNPQRGTTLDLRLDFLSPAGCPNVWGFNAEVTSSNTSVLAIASPQTFDVIRWEGFDAVEWRALIPVSATASAGTTRITVTAQGATAWVDVTVPEASLTSLDLSPSAAPFGGAVLGRVTLDTTASVEGMTVLLASSDSGIAAVPSSIVVAPGTREAVFSLTPQTVAAAADVVITASVAGQSKTASFRALATDAASFTGTVLNSGDWDVEAPLSGATVAVTPGVGQFLTGLDGAFHLYAPPGTASVTVSRQGFAATSSTPQSLSPGQAVDLGAIRLKRAVGGSCMAVGTVITPQGVPIEGATGILEGYDATYVTNAAGEYTVSLPSHLSRYRMTFSKAGYPAWTEDLTFMGFYPVDCLSVPYLSDLILDPNPRPALSSVSFLQPTVVSGGKVHVRPVLAGPAPPGGARVSMTLVTQGLSGTSWRALSIPGGQSGSGGSFEATLPTVEAPTTATYAFFYGGVTKRASIEVVPETLSISCPNGLTGATTASCTVSLSTGPAPAGGAVVALTSSYSSLFSVPASATVPQGQTSVSFPLTIGPFFGNYLSATLKGLWAGGWGERSISAFRPDVDRIDVSPTAVVGGGSATATVVLMGPAYPTGQTTVTLESTLPTITLPATVTVAPGESTATFPIATTSVSQPATGHILGRLTMLSGSPIVGAQQRGGSLLVTPSGLGLACTPAELLGGEEASCQVSLPGSPAPAGGTVVALTSPSGVFSVPASVKVPEGLSAWVFTVTAIPVVSTTSGVIRASLGTEVAEVTLTVRSSSLRSLDLISGGFPVEGGFRTSASVSLHGTAPAGGILVALSVAGTAATVPPSVLILEGNYSAYFPVTTLAVPALTDVVLTATYGSVSLTKTLPLEPQTWRLSPLAPGRVVAGAGGVTLYGRDFLPTNTIRLSGPVYSVAAPDVPLCDEPAGACPAVDASDATVVFQHSNESGDRIVFTVPASLSPGYYTVRAKSAAGTLSSEARWLLLDDPAPVVPALAPEQHGLARPITSGQTVTGTFVENGDTSGATNDFNIYYLVAAAGTRVSVRLERADTSLPWEHPDSLDPQVALIAPDGFVYENEGRQDVASATDLNAEITDVVLRQTGMWLIAASTSRGRGGYRLTYTLTPPASVPLDQRVIAFSGRGITAPVGLSARLTVAVLDPRGYPLSGAGIGFNPSYPDPVAGHVEWLEGQSTFTAVDGLAQCTVRATTPGAVDIRPNLLDVNGIINSLPEDPAAEALFQTALEGLPSYQPLEHHAYAVRDVDPDGNLSLDLGPVRAFQPAHPSRPRTEWKTGTGATKVLGTKAAPAPELEERATPRPLPPVEQAVASTCTELKLFRFEAVAASEVKAPFTVTLADVSPGKPAEGVPIGEKGIEGYRIEKTVHLKIDVRDRDGNTPPHPVLLRLSVAGPISRTGMLILDPNGARRQCKTAFLVWHDRDAQGTVIENDLIEYRLGTLSVLPGVEPDPDHPGQVKPVWGVAELLDVTAEVVTTDSTVISRKAFPLRPLPGKPLELVDWDGSLQDDGWEWWNGFYTYHDSQLGRRAVSLTSYNAYTLVDKYQNIVWGYRNTVTRNVPAQMTVGLPYQETTGPDFRAYALQLKWWADASDQMPQGAFPVLLVVPYAANEPDWTAGEVIKQTLIDLQGGNQTHLKFYDRYEARFGLDDGEFPMSVSPEAGPETIPKVGPPVFGAVPGRSFDSPRRLALVLVTGKESPSAEEVFRAPHHPWEWQGTGWVERPVVPVTNPHLDVASRPKLKMKLVDVNGNVQTAAGFKVHFCPRFDHEGNPTGPEWACPTAPRESTNGVIAELAMNPGVVGSGDPPSPDAAGYLGLELTKAPVAPGTYYVYVESLDKDVKIRDQSPLHLDDTPEGQFQGGFALCTVMSGEFLDGSLRRIDPFRVTEPMLVYVRVTSEASSGPTMSVDVRSERANKAIVTPKVLIDLPRCGVSGIYQAPVLLIPEACSAGPSSGGPSPLASLSVPLGEGHLWATAPAGITLASADTAFPAVLRLRFLTRDGSQLTPPDIPASPEMTGMTQQTAIGDSSDSYAESVWVEVRAENPFDWTQLQDTGVSVGIAEMANDRYQGPTQRFFVGTLGSTLLDKSGKVGGEKSGSFLSLDHGKARQRLTSVAERRLDALSGEPDPFLPYAGSRGAQLRPLPEAFIAGPADPREGPVLGVSLWVDEGTYNRRRDDVPVVPGVESYWARNPNTVRDWLEKKAWDVWADTQDDPSGQVNEMCRIPTQLVEDVSQVYAGAVSTSFPTIVKFNPMFRDIRCPSLAGNPWTIHYYGFYEKKPADGFPVIALHEARHCFQLSWVSRGAVDEDGDLLYAPNSCVTADSAELFDKPNRDDPRSGGLGNGDGHFKGDGPGLADGGDAKRTMREHEAMRFVNRTGSSLELTCALSGFTLRSSAELSGLAGSVLPGGVLVEVTAKRSQQATLIDEPRSGVTVRFTVPEASTALVNGAKRAWVMTNDAGQASVEITNGAAGSTTEITVDMLPPMAPQDQCTRYPFVTSLKVTLHAQ